MDLLTHKEAAAYLGVGHTKLYEMVKAGKILCRQDVPGGKRLYDKADLDAYHKTAKTPPPVKQICGTYRKIRKNRVNSGLSEPPTSRTVNHSA